MSKDQKLVRFTFHIPKPLLQAVREVAATRRVSLSAILVDSVKVYLEQLVGGDSSGKVASDLGRIDRRVKNLAIDVEVLGELMALYVYHWFCHQTPIAESQRKAVGVEGRKRFERFLELVKERRISERSVWKLLYECSTPAEDETK